jgi:hypothetical protein
MTRAGFAILLCLTLAGCKRPPGSLLSPPTPTPVPSAAPAGTPQVTTPPPTPSPSVTPAAPTPEPTPLLPRKPVEIGKMFNGITYRTKFVTPPSEDLASLDRTEDDSFQVEITFTAKLPRPSTTIEDLASNDPKLPHVLNKMPDLVASARVSPFFERLYKIKVATIRDQLFALDTVLSRHNFYDCETILELQAPETQRKALLIIGDMDVNVDGSDGDRNVVVDDSGRFFQPQTSYRWPKTTNRVNPLLTKTQERIATLREEAAAPGTSAARKREIQNALPQLTRTVNDLKSSSFLVSSTDPSIVVPSFLLKEKSPFAPRIGDYAAVIYDGVVYPTIVGDAGPSAKVGEASLRLCKQINPRSSANSRSVSNIKVAYLIFPGTAEKFGPPDLARWREKVKEYLDEMGGAAPELFVWEDIVPPWPTPTPSPTPTPEPEPSAFPTPDAPVPSSDSPPPTEPEASPTPETSATPAPSLIPSPTPSPSATPGPTVITPTTP